MKGLLTATLALIALQVVLSTPLANLGTAVQVPGQLAAKWMSPSVPLIPDLSGSQPAQTTGSTIQQVTGGSVNLTVPARPAAGVTLNPQAKAG